MDKIILSYHDSCLYESDYAIIKSSTKWLNDRIISFYLEFLHREVLKNDDILFIGKLDRYLCFKNIFINNKHS